MCRRVHHQQLLLYEHGRAPLLSLCELLARRNAPSCLLVLSVGDFLRWQEQLRSVQSCLAPECVLNARFLDRFELFELQLGEKRQLRDYSHFEAPKRLYDEHLRAEVLQLHLVGLEPDIATHAHVAHVPELLEVDPETA